MRQGTNRRFTGRWMLTIALLPFLHTAHANPTSADWQVIDDFEGYGYRAAPTSASIARLMHAEEKSSR